MHRTMAIISAVTIGLVVAAGPASAQGAATITLSPNPLPAGAEVTIANSPDAGSICQAPGGKASEVGSPEGGDVVVLLDQFQGPNEILTSASVDGAGNWQVVVQVPEAGEYNVIATCALSDFDYQPQTLSVTAAAPPAEPPPVPPPAPAAEPLSGTPAFTG